METIQETAKKHLIEQNARTMNVLREVVENRVKSETGKTLDDYLNALFHCLELPYKDENYILDAKKQLDILARLKKVEYTTFTFTFDIEEQMLLDYTHTHIL